MMAEMFGKRTGYCKGKGGSMHIVDYSLGILGANGIVGAGLPIATGSALGAVIAGKDDVTAGVLRRRRLQRGHLPRVAQPRGSVEIAGGLRMREQRLRRVHSDGDRDLGQRHRRARARPTTFPGNIVDGNDVLEVFRYSQRGGRSRPRRRRSHPARMQDLPMGRARRRRSRRSSARAPIAEQSEVEEWKRKCPMIRFEQMVRGERQD